MNYYFILLSLDKLTNKINFIKKNMFFYHTHELQINYKIIIMIYFYILFYKKYININRRL